MVGSPRGPRPGHPQSLGVQREVGEHVRADQAGRPLGSACMAVVEATSAVRTSRRVGLGQQGLGRGTGMPIIPCPVERRNFGCRWCGDWRRGWYGLRGDLARPAYDDEHLFERVGPFQRPTSSIIRGAGSTTCKDVSLDLPRDSLIVFTGLSGSGKSSLAFDTIFAEGQRRYVESLSAYARQFLGQMDKPDVDFIEGLSPAVSIDQKSTSKNPRSTVGTITEVYDYLRLLYARAGRPHCPVCGAPIERQTPQQIVDRVLALEEGAASRCSRR